MPSVTAIIPTFGRHDLTTAALQSLAAQTLSPDEVLIVDDGSPNPFPEPEKPTKLNVKILRHPKNRGFAPSINTGLRAAQSELLFLLNNDVTLSPTWLERIVAPLADPSLSFATGKSFRPDGLLDGCFDLLSKGGLAWKAGHGRPDGPEWSQSRRIQFPSFTSVVIKRSAFASAGPLDESYGSYYEDVQWSLRAAQAGLEGIYLPTAHSIHLGSQSSGLRSAFSTRQILSNHKRLAHQFLLPEFQNQFRIAWSLHRAQTLSHGQWPHVPPNPIDPLPRSPNLSEILTRSESTLHHLQSATGMDRLWHLYFRFTGWKG